MADQQRKLGWRRLGVTMSVQMLLIALVPLIVVATVVVIALSNSIAGLEQGLLATRQEMAQNVVGASLQGQAQITMGAIDTYMNERLHDAIEWARAPIVRQAAKDGAVRAEELGLTALTEDQIEERMKNFRALSNDPELTAYLAGLSARTPAFTEIFFTEKHGFNVAYNNPTSDFVQIGETWWDTAWSEGSYIGSVEYDASAGVYSVEIAMRIDDVDGNPLGVLKAVLDVQALQDLAADAASRVTSGEVRLFTQSGDLIADTASKNDPTMIMTEEGNLLQRAWEPARQILEQHQGTNGYLLDQQNLDGKPIAVGYAPSAPGSYYDTPGFTGFAWVVTVDQPEEVAFVPLRGLSDQVDQMGTVRNTILGLLLAFGAMTAIGAIVAAVFVSRRIVQPIVQLALASQRISAGELNTVVEVTQRNEIGQLEDAFRRMTEQLRRTLDKERAQREHLETTVTKYMTFVANVASGNLTTRLSPNGGGSQNDPLTILGHDLNAMVDNLHDMAVRVKDGAHSLSTSAAEILAATTQQMAGASEQSASIAQTTTTVDEVKAIADQAVVRAQEVANTAQRTVEVSQAGQEAVQDTIASMIQIKSRVGGIAENTLALSEQTQQIGEIIATVNQIATQSNMLALNASVEAARAGEHGKGFAVVAQEVRNLADQSRQATAQVKAILQDIQQATNASVMATEEGTKGVEEGERLVTQAQEVIAQLATTIAESAQSAAQVVAGGQQQASGIEQIALAMQQINQATMQSLTSTRQTEKTAQDLNELARTLTETVEQYQL
jgi:methyl-accepting chemotaxis protein